MNFLGLILCVIGSMIIGTVYYSKSVFGGIWSKLSGVSMDEMKKKDAWKKYLLVALAALILAMVLNFMMTTLQVKSISQALTLSTLIGLGFIATTSLTNTVFGNKSYKLYLLDNGYHLVNLWAMSVILTFVH